MGLTGRSHKHYSKLQQDDPDDESDGSAKEEGADPWFKGDLSARSAGDPRGEQGQAKGLMSGITSWGARDIREWRKELDDAAKDDTSIGQKAFTLLTAATSYLAGSAWSAVIKKTTCPETSRVRSGALCQDMDSSELAFFFFWTCFANVAVIGIVFSLHVLRDTVKKAVNKRADDGGKLSAEDEKLIASKALTAVDLVSGGWIYSAAALWTTFFHSFFSYTKLTGAIQYFLVIFIFVTVFNVLSWELVPVFTVWLREKAPKLAAAPADAPRMAAIAKGYTGSMAWLLGIALLMTLEVLIAFYWPTNDEAERPLLVYYWGGLHNIPLLARWLLCLLILAFALPVLTVAKRSKDYKIRDALVGALLDRGEWDAAAMLMRAFDRMKGLYTPMLACTAAQAIFRAVEKSFTPHSWDIFFFPESAEVVLTGRGAVDNQTAVAEKVTEAAAATGEQLGMDATVAGNITEVLNATTAASAEEVTQATDAVTTETNPAEGRVSDADTTAVANSMAKSVTEYQCDYTEDESTCFFDLFNCCSYRPFWGLNGLMWLYSLALTVGGAWILHRRDTGMRAKLERAIQLTEQDTAESMTAEKAQKAFVLEWELSGLFGSATAYIVGKVWNDVLTGQEGAAFYGFKTDHPMIFALFATAICVGFSIADAKDLFDKPAAALTKALGGATLAVNQPLQSGAQIELMPTETAQSDYVRDQKTLHVCAAARAHICLPLPLFRGAHRFGFDQDNPIDRDASVAQAPPVLDDGEERADLVSNSSAPTSG